MEMKGEHILTYWGQQKRIAELEAEVERLRSKIANLEKIQEMSKANEKLLIKKIENFLDGGTFEDGDDGKRSEGKNQEKETT